MKEGKKKILIIEDEKPLLAAIKSKLEITGYEAISAEDGERGLELIKEEKPDLVLLDILLPKKDGFEVLEELKNKEIKIPVIIISNSGQPVEINKAKALGAKDYLIKADFTPEEVLEKVEKIIGKGLNNSGVDFEYKQEPSINNDNNLNTGPVSSGKVLIVEDDEFLRQVVSQKLTKEGFQVKTAIDSSEAFKLIEESKPDIILLDLILPGMDGFEILRHLKENPNTYEIPVIVLSNLGQKEDIERAKELGAVDYLVKANFTPGEIVEKIRFVLEKKYI